MTLVILKSHAGSEQAPQVTPS
ncbi:hypothetical protein CHELA1G11_14413 [Hyphomicrobiales bacterium]|nr:hypothetical protein CHELA1G11_14413 [Hyphomicrobiales bacterium]CAH1680363.1 hypothetical protein CHELA1G2_14691 [Hyphomicrobiales bacterium]